MAGQVDAMGVALWALGALLALFIAMWALSLRTRDVGSVDIVWGPGFALVAWVWFAMAGGSGAAQLALLVCVTVWSARLGLHLFVRHRLSTGEDARYAAMRAASTADFRLASLWKVFLLQAVILWGLALPIHLAMAATPANLGAVGVIGLGLFMAGFMIEAIADWQLLAFRRDPARRGGLLTTGLFAWSRHPNYFGETVLWWGLGLVAFAASGSLVVFLGPLALTALLLKVSGVPLLEDHLKRTRPGYADYASRTSTFIPWPPSRRH